MQINSVISAAMATSANDPHANDRYIVSQITRLAGMNPVALDYGCGSGRLVAYARSKGIDMVGADVFYDGSAERREAARASGEIGRTIFAMQDSRLPFPDAHFDFVCSNQVFEHVADMDLALSEIRRVLKPGGVFLNIFPSVGVIRDNHCGVPMAHWLNRHPSLQTGYLFSWRLLGFGHYKSGRARLEWARLFSDYLRRFTHYRTYREIQSSYGRFFPELRHGEPQFAAYRLHLKGWHKTARWAQSARVRGITAAAVRRLGSMVLVARAR
jgi:SAM-dependent methyltransferase